MPFSYKPLWKLLVEHELTKTEFREKLGLSTATLAKLGKDEYVSLEVIDKICTHFGVQPNEIMEHKPELRKYHLIKI
ncbi:helix-turn-helix domain-containing protein [Paenibacillus ehimensis]|uniref:Helix-turn-helix transcriptional regulator n=1 Tax=Paenibacillus ehimensis TaxID=79264 RepID=A0ABT8VJT9_9BACL|nr:helix-turn-helix transcriptional regulator [Paenibacillus ehimensis]MDO3681247.1 helix-turn-helix transcriptional regulator [Paenibacillus ehimensis]